MSRIPLLILSDSPTAKTGLGRICRDIATRVHANISDVFEVATVGYGGPPSKKLGFPQYDIAMENWVISNLPDAWDDFSDGRRGVIFTIWDASRLQWLSRPEMCQQRRLRDFLNKKPFQTWGYWPIDATGVGDKLTQVLTHTMEGFDRSLAYTSWAESLMRRSMKNTEGLSHLPHGLDRSVFYPRNRVTARHGFGQRLGARYASGKRANQFISVPDDALFVGVVATNQLRKDWGLVFAVLAELKAKRNVMAWIHTDVIDRHWSISNLIYDFGMKDNVVVTISEPTDEQMAWSYSACDVTLGPGLGEGWGFPLAESLACGTPVIHGNYAGATEFVPKEFLVEPKSYRIEGHFNCVRPVFEPEDWVAKINSLPKKMGESLLDPKFYWDEAWAGWEEWFRKGAHETNTVHSEQESLAGKID